MSNTLEEFRTKFLVEELMLYQSEYWVWSLRPQQPTLGAGILSLRKFATRMSDVPLHAGKDLLEITRIIESTISKCFACDKINYLMLMMVDNHVHYHVIPRYAATRELLGTTWLDNGWPKQPALGDDQLGGDIENLQLLATKIKTNILIEL